MERNKLEISFLLLPDRLNVPASHEDTILGACIRAGVEIDHSCGGMGTCGTCHVFVEGTTLSESPRNEIETEMAQDRGFTEDERLACQISAIQGIKVRLPR